MKNSHPFIGITTHLRLRILKYLYPDFEIEIKSNLLNLVEELFNKEEREYHYIALDLIKKNIKSLYRIEHFSFIKELAEKKPNWDTIDIYAKDILGRYLFHIPELTQTFVNLFINSNNEWKIRSIILFQNHYKEKTNKNMLFLICLKFMNSKNSTIRSAIVWALKEYKKINPQEVIRFTHKHNFLLINRHHGNKQLEIINRLIYNMNLKKAIKV